jgi:hypothetical protein
VNSLGLLQTLANESEITRGSGDPLRGLLFKGVEDIQRVVKNHRVHRPICVAFIALDHLDDPGTAVSLEGLGILVLAALLGHSQGIPNDPLDLVGEPLEILA